jgi:hypothetical protein
MSLYQENCTALAFIPHFISPPSYDYITCKNLSASNSFHLCGNIVSNFPKEALLNTATVTFPQLSIARNTEEQDSGDSIIIGEYISTRTKGEFEGTADVTPVTNTALFGLIGPSKEILTNTTQNFNIETDYCYVCPPSATTIPSSVAYNLDEFGYGGPVYELQEILTNIFLYNTGHSLYIYRTGTGTMDDSIEITRIEKDYDNLTGTVQGISNRLLT